MFTTLERFNMYEAPDGLLWRSKKDYDRWQRSVKNEEAYESQMNHLDWPTIIGFSGYSISPEGYVANRFRNRLMKPHITNGVVRIALVNDEGKQTTLSLARLVALNFVPLPDDFEQTYYEVFYLDGDSTNVHYENLEWRPRWKRYANPDNYQMDI